ncbi:MAG: hybrid sensor histidine kinase/response regulator, partial [Leptospiraceae bacterium]|nr:hybrid sensor histidine kinase/response regulator [Leptospiraceae bacterium]
MIEMIQDEELRELFRIESEEHIQVIEKGLLELEKNPHDYETLHLIFREAHSMKGASRMLGISDIESIAHIFEEVLGKASRGEFELTSTIIDVYYEALDSIKKLVSEAVTGEKTDVDVVNVLDKLLATKPDFSKTLPKASVISASGSSPLQEKPSIKKEQALQKESFASNVSQSPSSYESQKPSENIQKEESIPLASSNIQNESQSTIIQESPIEQESEIDKVIESKKASIVHAPSTVSKKEEDADKKPVSAEQKKIDTMRVEPSKLDALMVQSGELVVTKNRISNRVKEAGEIQYFYEEVLRTILETKKLLTQLNKEAELNPKIRFLVSSLIEISSKQNEKFEQLGQNIKELKKVLSHDVARLSMTTSKIERTIYNIRMLSLNNVFNLFHRTIRDLGRETGKSIQLVIVGGEATVDKQILEELKDPLMHLIRNSVDHGLEPKEERIALGKPEIGTITLIGKTLTDIVVIEIKDDRRGLDIEKIKQRAIEKGLFSQAEIAQMDTQKIYSLIFYHGFSTKTEVTNLSGRGVGMDVVKNFVEKFRGEIEIDSELGKGTTFKLKLPIKFSTTHVLILSVGEQKYGIPTENIVLTKSIRFEDIFILEGKKTILIEKEPVYVVFLQDYLEISENKSKKASQERKSAPCILLKVSTSKFAVVVDSVIEKNEVIIKPFEGILKRVRNVTGVTILDSGEVCIILNPRDLVDSILKKSLSIVSSTIGEEKIETLPRVLVIDDSLTTRVQVKRILDAEGFIVDLAVDGEEGFEKITKQNYKCIVTDIEMPGMDGISLVKKLRSMEKYQDLPIIILTSQGSEKHIQQGKEAGASAYLIKSKFDRNDLITLVEQYI